MYIPGNNGLFKGNNRSTTKISEICSKLTIKTPEGCHSRRSGVFIVSFKQLNVSWVHHIHFRKLQLKIKLDCISFFLINCNYEGNTYLDVLTL